MYLDNQEWLQIDLLAGTPAEKVTARAISNLLKPGDFFVDVGAHVGWLTLLGAKAVGATGHVIAVDPQPYNAARILENAELNGFANITVVTAAASDKDTVIELRSQARQDTSRLSLAASGVNDTEIGFLCPCYKLDTLLERWAPEEIGLIKIDVEGFEKAVLTGATGSLMKTRNVILEILPSADIDDVDAIVGSLNACGFVIQQINGAPWSPGNVALENNILASKICG